MQSFPPGTAAAVTAKKKNIEKTYNRPTRVVQEPEFPTEIQLESILEKQMKPETGRQTDRRRAKEQQPTDSIADPLYIRYRKEKEDDTTTESLILAQDER